MSEFVAAWEEAIAVANAFDYGKVPRCLKCKLVAEIVVALTAARNVALGAGVEYETNK